MPTNPTESMRSAAAAGEPKIVACYGLGGAGVALSWGLACRVLDLAGMNAANGAARSVLPEHLARLASRLAPP